eukprot:746962-Hanusia_phi.AAC.10
MAGNLTNLEERLATLEQRATGNELMPFTNKLLPSLQRNKSDCGHQCKLRGKDSDDRIGPAHDGDLSYKFSAQK